MALPLAPLCLDCDAELRPPTAPGAFLVARGSALPTSEGLITGICKRCAERDGEELLRIGVAYLRKIWPDLRTVDAANIHFGGRA
jgi:hypothetical protein